MTTTDTSILTPTATPPSLPPAGPLFSQLALAEPLLRALAQKNYTTPSPIQAQSIPYLLEGRDLIGVAQTGTGKTAAFALPILQRLAANPGPAVPKRPRALVLAPTRELAAQIAQSFADYGKFLKLSHAAIFGGVSLSPQIRALSRGVDILIATPGRLMDLERQRHVNFDKVEVFVLDEADRMLDLGFVHEIKRIIAKLPPAPAVAPLLRHHAARDPGPRLVARPQRGPRGGHPPSPPPWSGSSRRSASSTATTRASCSPISSTSIRRGSSSSSSA